MASQQVHGVHPVSSYCDLGRCSKQLRDVHRAAKSITGFNYRKSQGNQIPAEERLKINNAKHKYAERARRSEISEQYKRMREVLPGLIKTNKASLLREAIRQVKELQNAVSSLKETPSSGGGLQQIIPGEADRLTVGNCEGLLVKVMFSCDDKEMLMSKVAGAVASVKGKVVKAEMVAIGGRTNCVLWVKGIHGNEAQGTLRRAVKSAIERPKKSRAKNQNGAHLCDIYHTC